MVILTKMTRLTEIKGRLGIAKRFNGIEDTEYADSPTSTMSKFYEADVEWLLGELIQTRSEARKDALMEAAKVVCSFCREGSPIILSGTAKVEAHPGVDGVNFKCNSIAIRKLAEESK